MAGEGNTIEDSVQVCRWLEAAGRTRSTSPPAARSRTPRTRPASSRSRTWCAPTTSCSRAGRARFATTSSSGPGRRTASCKALGARPGRGARTLAARRAPREAGRRDPGDRHRRVPAGLADRRRPRARRLRRRLDRARARGEQRPRRALPGGPRPAAEAVHVLQQVPLQRARAPDRLLRRAALSLARGDDRADHVRLRA